MLIDGKEIANKILEKIAEEVKELKAKGIEPSLAVVLVGDDQSSLRYVAQKEKAALKVGIDFKLYRFPAVIKTEQLIREVQNIQKNDKPNALIVQLPLPDSIDSAQVLNAIDHEKDVDCLTYFNLGKLAIGEPVILPPTPTAIFAIIKDRHVGLAGKQVVVVGCGSLVGKPLVMMLMRTDATVTVCNSTTHDLLHLANHADILISAVGKPGLITKDMVKDGALVIDAGFAVIDGKVYGDVDVTDVSKKASAVTPTPGGVGPITVAQLLSNVVDVAKMQNNE